MSKFILFKRDDVDPYYRRIIDQSDVPKEFQDRVKVYDKTIIIDQKRLIHTGVILNFNSNPISYGKPFENDYLFTPIGYIPKSRTLSVCCKDGKLFIFVAKGNVVYKQPVSIDNSIFNETLVYNHVKNMVEDFREYYKETLQS